MDGFISLFSDILRSEAQPKKSLTKPVRVNHWLIDVTHFRVGELTIVGDDNGIAPSPVCVNEKLQRKNPTIDMPCIYN